MGDWTLLSNHGHVLVCLARDNEARLRSVADAVGITERAVQKIVRELQQGGFIEIAKHGRCNRYSINTRKNLRHALESKCSVGRLLKLLGAAADTPAAKQRIKADDIARTATPPKPESNGRSALGDLSTDTPESMRTVEAKDDEKAPKKQGKSKRSGKLADERNQGSLF